MIDQRSIECSVNLPLKSNPISSDRNYPGILAAITEPQTLLRLREWSLLPVELTGIDIRKPLGEIVKTIEASLYFARLIGRVIKSVNSSRKRFLSIPFST